ncbi:cache domain-containing protein [Cystobacter fuscus]
MATNTPVVSEVIELRRPVRTALIVAVPIRDDQGQPRGVVNVVMETHLLAQRYLSTRHHSQQEILLVDPAGRLAFHTHSPTLPFERGSAFASFPRCAGHSRAARCGSTGPRTHSPRRTSWGPSCPRPATAGPWG